MVSELAHVTSLRADILQLGIYSVGCYVQRFVCRNSAVKEDGLYFRLPTPFTSLELGIPPGLLTVGEQDLLSSPHLQWHCRWHEAYDGVSVDLWQVEMDSPARPW